MKPSNQTVRSTRNPFFPTAMTLAGVALLASHSARAASGTWTGTTAGPFNWSDTTQWNTGTVADGAGFSATFNIVGGSTVTTTLDTARTIGSISRGGSGTGVQAGWTVTSASNALTLDNGASNVNISIGANANTIVTVDTDIVLNSNLNLFANGNANNQIILGATAGGHTISGAKNITFSNNTSFGAGRLTINSNINTTGGVFNNSLQSSQALTINGIIGSTVTGVTQSGTVGLTLTGANTYTSATTVSAGTLTVNGANGSIALSSGITLTGGKLFLDNSGTYNADRIANDVSLRLGSELSLTGNSAASALEAFGVLTFGQGNAILTATSFTGQTASLSATSLARTAGAFGTGFVRGSSLGGAGASFIGKIALGATPSGADLVGSGGAPAGSTTTKNLGIVPWIIGATSPTSTAGTGFVTYDTTSGSLRPLVSGEYEINTLTLATAGNNVKDTTASETGIASTTLNSLILVPAAAQTITGAGGGSNVLTITSGSLASALASGAIGTAAFNSTISGFDAVAFGNDEALITVAQTGGSVTMNSPVSVTNSGGLTKAGVGTLTLGAANSYTGMTSVNQGTLVIAVSNPYSGQTTVNQGTLQIGSGVAGDLGSNTNNIVLAGTTSAITFPRTNAGLTVANNISGAGTVTQNGAGGTTVLTGTNTYTGATAISAGTLSLTGSLAGTPITVSGTAELSEGSSGVISGAASLTHTSSGTSTLAGTNSYTGTTTVSAGTLNFNNTTPQTLGSLTNNATVEINGNTSFTSMTLSGGAFTSLLNVNNGGTLNLSGAVLIGQNNNTANATLHILGGGTVNVSGTSQFVVANAASPNTPTGVLTMDANSALTLTGSGSFQLATGSATTSGTVNLDGGTLTNSRAIAGSVGNSTFNFNGGTLKSGAAFTMSGLTTANVRNGGAIIDSTGGTITMTQALLHSNVGGDLATDGGLTKNGSGTLSLSGANTFTGATAINAGSLLLSHVTALTTSSGVTVTGGAALQISAVSPTFSTTTLALNGTGPGGAGALQTVGGSGTTTWNGAVSLGSDSLIAVNGSTKLNIGGTIDLGNFILTVQTDGSNTDTFSNIISGPGGITKTSTSKLVLSGANIYTGATNISGGTLALGANSVLSGSTAVSIGNATLDAATFANTAGTLDAAGTSEINLGTGAALAFANSSAISWTGGTLTITGTYVSGSSLRFGTTSGGLTPTQLALISKPGGGAVALDSSGYLVDAPVGGYSAWQTANGTAGALDADHDNDGVSNGVEYFLFGTANSTGFTALPSVTSAGGVLSVTWTKAASYPVSATYGTDFVVQTSSTLVGAWVPAPLGVGAGNVEITGNAVKYTFPAGTKDFARLKVTGP